MGCKELISYLFNYPHQYISRRFRWVYCQLDYLGKCLPGRVQHALDELPVTLDETYERTLHEIGDRNWEFTRRLIQCVAVVYRPLRVGELAEFLAFDFKAGQIPTFREDWRLEDPVDAVLSTCSTLLSLVNVENSQVIQFSHFSVKEYLTSVRFGEKRNAISSRYHVSMTPAHTLVAQACLGMLLHLDKNITETTLPNVPLAGYAAEHWFEHARFEAVSRNVEEGMVQLFDRTKPHLAVWLWICDPTVSPWERDRSVEAPQTPRGTPLHYAAFCGLSDVVKFLAIEHPEDVNSRSFTGGEMPFHLNSRTGYVDVARLLIGHGADVVSQDEHKSTPLHRASSLGHIDLVQLLIEHGADAAAKDEHGWTPLHLSSPLGDVDLARLLIEHGADAAAQDEHGSTPLHRASSRGHVDLARLLIEHGADVAAQDEHKWTPLHWASEGGHVDLAQLLIKHGANAAAQDENGWTSLHRASSRGHVDLARLLIEHGADAAAQDKDGSTLLHLASSQGHADLARLLIEHGADAAAQDGYRWTPLNWASESGHGDVAQLLIEHGANAAAQGEDGWTPLHRACYRGDVDLARLLIEHGAEVSAQDDHGWTPLHMPSTKGHVDVARLLIEHGADMAAQDERGWTPLHAASSRGHVDLARLLVEHGADIAAQDKDGRTPLHRSSERGHVDLARLLSSMVPRQFTFCSPNESIS